MLELSPNQVVDVCFSNIRKEKPCINQHLLKKEINELPVEHLFGEILGSGDYNRSKSTEGSVTMVHKSDYVVKIPLGESSGNSFNRAIRAKTSINNFSEVSPDTMVIMSQVSGEKPKPVIIQKRVYGLPLCNTPFSVLFQSDTLNGIKSIIQKKKDWYLENNSYDLCGQNMGKTFFGKIALLIPFLSENIMADKNGKVFLVDNVLEKNGFSIDKKGIINSIFKKTVVCIFPMVVINTAILARKVYDLLNGKIK